MIAIRSALILLVVLIATPAVLGDVVVLKNGHRQSGKVVEETEKHVVLEIPGLGRITYARRDVKEIVRDEPVPAKKEEVGDLLRVEHSFVWSGDRRRGTRSVRVRKMPTGDLQLEETVVFYDDKGKEEVREFLIEVTDAALEPKSITYRSQSAAYQHALRGDVRDGALHVVVSLPGKRRESKLRLPEGVRFPLSAREQIIRERKRIKGSYEIPVFDPREENFYKFTFTILAPRKVNWEGQVLETTVIRRKRSDRPDEEIWVDPNGAVQTEQLNGPVMVAIRTSAERLAAFQEGKRVEASPEEMRVRPLVVHPEAGFRLVKPGLAWEFKKTKPGKGPILSLSNLQYFAYVDVFIKDKVPEGGLLSSLAVQMEKDFSGASKDFKKVSDGFLEVAGRKACRIVATSKNKGEELKSVLVGFLHEKKTWYVTFAAPTKYFAAARPEFEQILKSFEFIESAKKDHSTAGDAGGDDKEKDRSKEGDTGDDDKKRGGK